MRSGRRGIPICGALAAVASAVGCGAGVRGGPSETTPVPAPVGNTQQVSESNLAHLWPFTVDHGTISCTERGKATFTTPSSTIYGLNDVATSSGLLKPDPIRRKEATGTSVSLGALTSMALNLCE